MILLYSRAPCKTNANQICENIIYMNLWEYTQPPTGCGFMWNVENCDVHKAVITYRSSVRVYPLTMKAVRAN